VRGTEIKNIEDISHSRDAANGDAETSLLAITQRVHSQSQSATIVPVDQGTADRILEAILALPPQERLRLVERVIHELAEAERRTALKPNSVIGLFADAPDLLDAVVHSAMDARERDPLRR
jgi:hypothetical protein